MNVLFVTSSLSYGGAAKMLVFVANGLCEQGNTVCIANLMEVAEEIQTLSPSIRIERITSTRKRYIDKLQKIFSLRKTIRVFKPDIIVSFKSTPTWMTCAANVFLHIPIVFSERGDPYRENLKRPRTYVYWKMINSVSGAVFQTYGAKECYEEKLQRVATVIPNPVFEVLKHSQSGYEKAIVSFGRFENKQKRYDIMIDAFEKFHKTHKEYKLKLYGTGEDETLIKKWVAEKKLEDCVVFLGYTNKPYNLMNYGNIFLITSDYEGIANSMLEAMAAGFPVVSTDSSPGGAKMVIENGENGFLVPVRDSKRIADALSVLADDKILYEKCATNARQVTTRFEPQKILQEWSEYLIAIAKRGRYDNS